MKKTWILMLPLLITAAALAQPGKATDGRQHQRGQAGQHSPLKNLQLTPAQQQQVQQLQAQLRKELQSLHKNEAITVKDQRDRREQLMKNHRQAVQQLLTPEQQQKMAAQRASQQAIHQHQLAIQLERMKTKLQLTEAQVTKLQAQRDKMQAGMLALRQNDQLDRADRQAQMLALHQQMKAQLEQILTKEQLQKMKDKMPPRGSGGPRFGHGRGGQLGR